MAEPGAQGQAAVPARSVLIVGELDGFANGQKPTEIARFLRSRGHEVHVANTYLLSRATDDPDSPLRRLPSLRGVWPFTLYLVELAQRLFTRRWRYGRRHLSYPLIRAELWLRRRILSGSLSLDNFDLIIGEHPSESEFMLTPTTATVIYDCMTPWADELYFERRLTEKQHQKMRRHEARILDNVDHLSFSWETYAPYAVKHYNISGRNLTQLNWGCTPVANRVRFRSPPRIVLMGSLSSHFINLPMLSRLSRLYPIDVYGGPPPDASLGINYLGWAPSSVLDDYQLGLITCSTDELRRDGFSAKNMAYVAHGLPVLVPAWRRHMHLIRGSVPYDEDTFLSVVEALSDEAYWQRLSDEAYAQAQELTWERTLEPADRVLRDPSQHHLTSHMRSMIGSHDGDD